jgi:hypothetical protein
MSNPDLKGTTDGAARTNEKKKAVHRSERRVSPPQEKYLNGIIQGLSPTNAYRAAYPTCKKDSAKNNAYRSLKLPYMKKRLAQLRVEAGKRNEVTINEVIYNLRRARDEAFAEGRLGEAIRATELLGKYLCMFNQTIDMNLSQRNPFIPTVGDGRNTSIARLKMLGGNGYNPMPLPAVESDPSDLPFNPDRKVGVSFEKKFDPHHPDESE